MCRLLGMMAACPAELAYCLVDAPNSLRRQAERNPDGWGIAAFQNAKWRLRRRPVSAAEDEEFEQAARTARGTAFVCHVRKASRGAPEQRNTQPFQRDGWVFGHNGTILEHEQLLSGIDQDLTPRGDSDSEAFFCLFLNELRRQSSTPRRAAAAEICAALRASIGRVKEQKGLSFLLADGRRLFWYRDGRELRLLRPTSPDAGPGSQKLLVASEPVDEGGQWADVPERVIFWAEGPTVIRCEAAVPPEAE